MDTTVIRAEAFFVCRSLEIINNELFILGGGWTRVGFFSFPGVLQSFFVAVRLIVPFTETNLPLTFDVSLETEDGSDILPHPLQPSMTVGRPVDLKGGEEQSVHMPLEFNGIEIPGPGRYTFKLHHNGAELASTSFTAVQVSPGM